MKLEKASEGWDSSPVTEGYNLLLLAPTSEGCGKVMFLHLSVHWAVPLVQVLSGGGGATPILQRDTPSPVQVLSGGGSNGEGGRRQGVPLSCKGTPKHD